MKLLVCISKTPDTTARIAFTDNNTAFDSSGVAMIMNPYDDWYALVRALELKEAAGGSVTIVNVGPVSNDTIIRKGLALGADKAVRIDTEPASAIDTARQIAAYARGQDFDIILSGKETIDYNGSEVGAMLAELLELPFVSYATQLEMEGNLAVVAREIEGGTEVIEVSGPFVLSAAKGLATQRIPNMMGIMKAKRSTIEVVAPVDVESPVRIAEYALPPEKSGVKLVDPDRMDELVSLLHKEARAF